MEILSNTFHSFTSFVIEGASKLQTLPICSVSCRGNGYAMWVLGIRDCFSLNSIPIGIDSLFYSSSVVVVNTVNVRSVSVGNGVFSDSNNMEMRWVGVEWLTLAHGQFPSLESLVLSGMNGVMSVCLKWKWRNGE